MERDFRICPNCNHVLFACHDGDTYHSVERHIRLICRNQNCEFETKMPEQKYRGLYGDFNR